MMPTGIAMVAGFIVILTVCIMMDKKTGKKFVKDIEEQYPAKDIFKGAYVTERGKLLFRWGSGTLPVERWFRMNEIEKVSNPNTKREKIHILFLYEESNLW